MTQEPLVSVIMNCYNGETYLKMAIDSVLAQTYQKWELVVWDNRSTDRSAELIRSYSDPRIRYFYAPTHTVLYEARNCAIARAAGELFAFLDVDDWWLAEKLERQVPLFDNPEVGIVCGNYWVVDERRRKPWIRYKRPIPTGWVLNDLLTFYFVGLLTLVVRRSALESLSYPCDSRYHMMGDLDLVVRLSMHSKLGCVQEPIAFNRQHALNESRMQRGRHVDELERWITEMNEIEAIRSSPGWASTKHTHTYLKAIDRILLGDRAAARSALHDLPWGPLKLRLLLTLFLPKVVVNQLK